MLRVADSVPNVAADRPTARASGRVSGAVTDTGTNAASGDKLKLSQGERGKQANTESKVAATKALKGRAVACGATKRPNRILKGADAQEQYDG